MKERLQFIDGLRGFASLIVVIAHSWLSTNQYNIVVDSRPIAHYLSLGSWGVNLFMIISGFSLAYSLIDDGGWKQLNIPDFFRRRALRIIPPYYISIALFVALAYIMPALYDILGLKHRSAFPVPNLLSIITHPLFIHNAFFKNATTINGVYWSLEMEVQFYLMFPILIYIARRFGVLNMVACTFIVSSIWRILVWDHTDHNDPTIEVFLAWSGPGRLFEFGLGILAAFLVVRFRQRIGSKITLALSFLFWWLALFFVQDLVGQFHPISDAIISLGFFFLVLSAATHGLANRVFTLPVLVWVGAFSYSLYLIHDPILKELYTWFPNLQGMTAFFTYTITFSIVALIVGYLFYLVVERPVIGWGRRIARRQSNIAIAVNSAETHAAP